MSRLTTLAAPTAYPEGPTWWGGRWVWVEYAGHRLLALGAGGPEALWEEPGFGPAAAAATPRGTLWIAGYDADALVELTPEGQVLRRLTHDEAGAPLRGPNDMVVDAGDGLYFSACGPFAPGRPAEDRLYHLPPGAPAPRRVAEGLAYPNGLALLDGGRTLVVAEHLANRLARAPIDAAGVPGPFAPWIALATLAPAPPDAPATLGPDGLAIDKAGRLWVAHFGAGRVLAIAPDAPGGPRLLAAYALPMRFVTNVAPLPDRPDALVVTAFAADAPPFDGALYALAAGERP